MSTLRFSVECILRTVCAMIILGCGLSLGWIAWEAPSYTRIEIAILFTPLLAYIAIWKLWLPILRSPYWNKACPIPPPPRGVVTKIYCQSTGMLLTSEAIPHIGSGLNWPKDIFDRDELEELLRVSQDVLASHQK